MIIYDELLRAAFFADARPAESMRLPFERRQRARQRVTLDSGREVGIVLDRGTVMRGGDGLRHRASGEVIAIIAAIEPVSTVRCDDRRELARIAYHLGNRHVPLEVGDGWVRYERDHVLDDMVRGLGGRVAHEDAPFEPEAGAYAANEHHHPHHREADDARRHEHA